MDDIRERSPDAEIILQGIEFDLPWREIQISPKTALTRGLKYRGLSEPTEDFIIGFLRSEPKRFNAIREWAGDELQDALYESPILIIKNDDGWYLVDGWHRTALAWAEGLGKITALVIDGTGYGRDDFDG